ncbi:polysaccharide deacetylase family protein [Streptomyces sp. RB6PN25]|uniref:Polysaccharide deacetylase family protein n=1 Tax=Streptomyces humicola TaxID=2953240 RepID=A0ABT1Q209_9ACTN|nr:polysaccharide deacetylase family protein [Streptomyces humicola]MCQ4083969.1 polysaccharide deacetylase family protein [Streptomyces humicola]
MNWRRVLITGAAAAVAMTPAGAVGAHAAAPRPAPNCLVTKCVALSFDDGPSRYTPQLLGTLEARHAVATFFLIGPHALAYRQDVLREYRDGDAIGDHTVHHPDLTKISSARVSYEINTAAQQIASITGHRPTMLRPPYGAWNARVRSLAGKAGLSVIMWNVDPQDWKYHNTPLIERRVLAAVRPGAIIEMHDTYATTPPAIPQILTTLKARGYSLVTLPQLFAKTGGMKPGVVYHHGP